MYAAGALRAILTFIGFLLPALLIFLAVTLLARMLRGRERKQAGETGRRIAELEAEIRSLRRRLDALSAKDAETVSEPPVLPAARQGPRGSGPAGA